MCFRAKCRGFTLIELIMFIVIVSAGLAGILAIFNVATRSSADPLLQKQAQSLAEGILEEVQLAQFAFCDGADPRFTYAWNVAQCTTPDSFGAAGQTRPFNTVMNYVSAFGTETEMLTDISGAAWPAGYRAFVLVDNTVAIASGTAASTMPVGDALLIRVRVTGPGNTTATSEAYKMRQIPRAPPAP